MQGDGLLGDVEMFGDLGHRPGLITDQSLVDPDGFESLESFLAQLWPSALQRLKQAVETERGD